MQRGGEAVDDPVGWFNSLPDDVVDVWRCHWMAEPWGMEWDRHADMMHLLDCLVQLSANRGLHPRHQDWSKRYMARKPQEFMPGDYVRDYEKRQSIPIDKQLAEYAKVYCRGNYNQ